MVEEVMGKNTMIRLTDAEGEERWFNNTTQLEVYLSDVASREYTTEVLSRLASGEESVTIADGQFTDTYEYAVVPVSESTTIIKFVAQYVPAGGRDWVDLAPWDSEDDAVIAINENITGWNQAESKRGSLKFARPERYRIIKRAVTEVMVKEMSDNG